MLNAVSKSSCFNVQIIKNNNNKKKINSIPVVEDGAKQEGVVSISDEHPMKETLRHMRELFKYITLTHLPLFLDIP